MTGLRLRLSPGFTNGTLTVVEQHERSVRFYWCDCLCGRKRVLIRRSTLLINNRIASCGRSCGIRPNSRYDVKQSEIDKLYRIRKPKRSTT